jgi:hypothetical protein
MTGKITTVAANGKRASLRSLKIKGEELPLLGQVIRDRPSPIVNVTHREPVTKVWRPAVRDHKFAKAHFTLTQVLQRVERWFTRRVGDLLTPKTLDVA